MPAYSEKAQPFLDAIAQGVFSSTEIRNWIIDGTTHDETYRDAHVLHDEQKSVRWAIKPTKQPFWANYHCGKDSRCNCRIEGSTALESDAIFFLRNEQGRTMAIHLEFKHPREAFGYGQPEAYPLRAACFSKTHFTRKTLNAHQDWITVLFCGDSDLVDPRCSWFDRVVPHSESALRFSDWPA